MATKTKETTTVKVSDAVAVYNTLASLKVTKLKKEDMFLVLRAANALKPVATAFEGFVKDAQERLKPEGWDAITEKNNKFKELSDTEKAEVNKAIAAYNKDVTDCVQTELDREAKINSFTHLGEEAIGDIVAANDSLDVAAIMRLQSVIG